MTAVDNTYQAIFNKVPGVDRHHKKRITGKIDNAKTDLLITLVTGNYAGCGSNTPTIGVQEVEVQIFIGIENRTAGLGMVKSSITSFLVPKWQVSYGPNKETDPETDEITLTFRFTRNFIMRGN